MKNIRLIRVTRGYTQLKIQMETGISQSALSKYERGELTPTVPNLILLAKFYGTSLDYLMDMTSVVTPYPKKQRHEKPSAYRF